MLSQYARISNCTLLPWKHLHCMLKKVLINIALEMFTEHAHSMVTEDFMSIFSNEVHFDSFTVVYGSCVPSSPKESISPW